MPDYPINIPEGVGFSKAKWGMRRSVVISESPFTGKQQTYEYPYALWAATLTVPPMNRVLAGKWIAFITKLHGRRGTFLLGNPDHSPKGSARGEHELATSIEFGDNTIDIRTNFPNAQNTYRAGDFIQIGGGAAAKLYMITDDANTGIDGVVSVNIEPSVKAAVSAGAEVEYINPRGVFRMDKNDLQWDSDRNRNYSITFGCTEVTP